MISPKDTWVTQVIKLELRSGSQSPGIKFHIQLFAYQGACFSFLPGLPSLPALPPGLCMCPQGLSGLRAHLL